MVLLLACMETRQGNLYSTDLKENAFPVHLKLPTGSSVVKGIRDSGTLISCLDLEMIGAQSMNDINDCRSLRLLPAFGVSTEAKLTSLELSLTGKSSLCYDLSSSCRKAKFLSSTPV